MVLDASLLNTHHYKVWMKGKWWNTGKRVALSPTLRCSSYWKGSLQVTLDYGWPTYFLSLYIYLGSISSLIHIWLNNIDIVCLHIFVLILSLPHWFYGIQRELINKLLMINWAIIRLVYIAKKMPLLHVRYYFVSLLSILHIRKKS